MLDIRDVFQDGRRFAITGWRGLLLRATFAQNSEVNLWTREDKERHFCEVGNVQGKMPGPRVALDLSFQVPAS